VNKGKSGKRKRREEKGSMGGEFEKKPFPFLLLKDMENLFI
jgi:hypothetical protein